MSADSADPVSAAANRSPAILREGPGSGWLDPGRRERVARLATPRPAPGRRGSAWLCRLGAMMKRDGPIYVLTVRPLRGVDPVRALRGALKVLLRRFGLICISIQETTDNGGAS